MWMLIIAAFLGFFYSTWDMQASGPAQAQQSLSDQDVKQVANGMVVLANVLGNYLYKNPMQNGQVDLTKLPVPVRIDRRIGHSIQNSRIWIYTSENIPSLTTELQRISTNSALICIVKNGRLQMLNGADMNLTVPAQIKEGSVVYLN